MSNLLVQIEEYDPTGDGDIDREFRGRLRRRYAELARARKAKATERLREIETSVPAEDPAILDLLPHLTAADLATIDDAPLRELFDAFRLEVRYRYTTHEALIKVTLKEDALNTIYEITGESCAHVLGAPGGT
jgi:hypothetical protein